MPVRQTACFVLLALFLLPAAKGQLLGDITDSPARLKAAGVETSGKRALHRLQSATLSAAFTGVAVEAETAYRSVTAQVRIARGEDFGPWQPMTIVRSAVGDALVAGFRGKRVLPPARFEVRFNVGADQALTVGGAGTFDGDEAPRLPTPGIAPMRASESGDIVPPPLITRNEWGARPFMRGSPSPLARPEHEFMTFHHAAGFSATTREEGIAQVRAIQDLHQDIRGWSDIGYHFVIDRGGRLYQGRPFLNDATSLSDLPVFALGAHVGGANTGNIGVSMLGCYHPPEGANCRQEITPAALNTYITLFAFLSERYGVAPSLIRGHRDFSSTACPGDNNYQLLPDVRTAVAQLLITGNAPLAEAVLTAQPGQDGVVRVSWEFLADFGVAGYRVERWRGDSREAVLASGVSATSSSVADAGVSADDPVNYRLYVTGSDGREQRVASTEVSIDLPTRHALAEVFPNPSRGVVRFRYFLPTRGTVSLELFDTTGRRVAQVAEGLHEGEQWYSVPFDTAQLSGGVYYFRMAVSGFSGTVFEKSQTLIVAR